MTEHQRVTESEISAALVDSLQRAGVHPAYIDAFRKCGFLLTEDNVDLFDDDDIEQWNEVVGAWRDAHPGAA